MAGVAFGATATDRPKKNATPIGMAFWGKAPGDDLLLHGLSHTTIGAVAFHFRVREGIGWFHNAMITRERVEGRSDWSSVEFQTPRTLSHGVNLIRGT